MPNLIGVHEATVPKPARLSPAPDCFPGTTGARRKTATRAAHLTVCRTRPGAGPVLPGPAGTGHACTRPGTLEDTPRPVTAMRAAHSHSPTAAAPPPAPHGVPPCGARILAYGARPARGGADSFAATSRRQDLPTVSPTTWQETRPAFPITVTARNGTQVRKLKGSALSPHPLAARNVTPSRKFVHYLCAPGERGPDFVTVDRLSRGRPVVFGQQGDILHGNAVRGQDRHEGVHHLPGRPVLTEACSLGDRRNARITLFAVRGVPTLDAKTRP